MSANLANGGWYEVEGVWTGFTRPVIAGRSKEVVMLEDVILRSPTRIRMSHAWVKIGKRVQRFGFLPGDTIKFVGQAAPYQRADGTQDWAFAVSPDIARVKA